MALRYDPDAAVAYAGLHWDRACSDGFVCLAKASVAKCTGKPAGDPFVAVAAGTRFAVSPGPPLQEEVVTPFGKLPLATDCLDDATHFVSCCIGSPPTPPAAPPARGGGYRLPSDPRFPKAPYGATDAASLASVLERDPEVRALVRKCGDRHLPAGVRNGDVIVYSRNGRYTHAAIFVSVPDIAAHSVSRWPAGTPLVSSAWDYVVDLDAAFRWSIYHLPTPVTKFAVEIGPFPDKMALTFDAAKSALLDTRVKVTGGVTEVAGRSIPAQSAKTLAAGLVDLTGNPAHPAFGGWQDTATFFVGSVAKVYAAFAAFELRSRVRRIVDKAVDAGSDPTQAGWERPVIAAIEDAWKAKVSEKRFGDLDTSFPRRFPKLATIFDFRPDGSGQRVRFRKGGASKSDVDAIDDVQERGSTRCPAENMAFQEWLDLMIRWSNDCAADRVITALGFPYINGVLREAGFQSSSEPRKGPLFISGSYMGRDWQPGKDLGLLGGRGTLHYKGTTNFVGNSAELARLLTWVATSQAFGGDAAGRSDCAEMLAIMRQGPGIAGVGSFIQEELAAEHPGPPPVPPVSSKIGIGVKPGTQPDKPKGVHDCAVVERNASPTKTVRYVMVVLGGYSSDVPENAPDPEAGPFDDLINGLDAWLAS